MMLRVIENRYGSLPTMMLRVIENECGILRS